MSYSTLEKVVGIVGMTNFLALLVVSSILGGDALNGKVSDGHYLVASHGRYTEVSRAAFRFSEAQTASVFVTHPLMMLMGWRSSRRKRIQAGG